MDATNTLLQRMIEFGNAVITYSNNINLNPYRFVDICEDSQEHQNTEDHIALKAMSASILLQNKTLYQKLPFMYFIYVLSCDPDMKRELPHDKLRRIITNLYVYSSLFALNPTKKKKELIDHTVRDALRSNENRVDNVVNAAKSLRTGAVSEYQPNQDAKFEELATVYSIMDNYISNTNWIPVVYSREAGFNLEHFVIPDIRSAKIKWKNGEEQYPIQLDREYATRNKKRACNHLIIDHDLNESMDNFDILTKIRMINEWHASRNIPIPRHVTVFISHIEALPGYQHLLECRESGATSDVITPAYQAFLDEYFADESQNTLFNELKEQFCLAFQN